MKRTVYDKHGNIFEIDSTILNMPAAPPVVTLTDTETGEQYQVSESLFESSEPVGGSDTSFADALMTTPPSYHEKLVEILLERCTISNPGIRQDIEMLIGPVLAIGKITSREEYHIVLLEIENLVRALYMSGAIDNDDSVYLIDQLTFFARWQARRSITYDGKPNERELWTIQSIHQRSEMVQGEKPSGFIGGLSRMFGRGG